ncbi:hypothetical protein KJ603_00160 [Patescibacteria group bacterium]|nr:hypothetical protein [Patescibacteria group bacterium]
MLNFPPRETLSYWVSGLKKFEDNESEPISNFLPKTDTNWEFRMLDIFSRLKYKYSVVENNDICIVAAELFYNVNKYR